MAARRRWGRAAVFAAAAGVVFVLSAPASSGRAAPAPATPVATRTVVVTARAVAAGTVLSAADVEQRTVADSAALDGVMSGVAGVAGRTLSVALPAGALVARYELGAAAAPGHRLVAVSLDPQRADAQLAPGQRADVVAVLPSPDDRVVAIGTATVVAVRTDASSSTAAEVVTLDCDAALATRLIWAENFAHEVRLLADGDGVTPPPAGSLP